jgi:kumamolisin
MVIGGTSAVAPLWAGLIALANAQNKATAGFLQPTIYSGKAKTAFRDVTSGDNGAFKAAPGWDACTGLGSPNGAALAQLLAGATMTKKPTKKTTSKTTKKKSAKS